MTSPRQAWLAQVVEDAIEPDLPICDPHHHFWDREGDRYLLDQLTDDLGGGHNVTQTVFIECHSMYRASGPEEMRSVGEIEFVQGLAAQSASGQYGPTEGCGRHRRATPTSCSATRCSRSWKPTRPPAAIGSAASAIRAPGTPALEVSPGSPNTQGMLADPRLRAGFNILQRMGLSFDALVYPHPVGRTRGFGRGVPKKCRHHPQPHRPPAWCRDPNAGRRDEVFADWQQGIAAVAQHENVVCKLGGFGATSSAAPLGISRTSRPPHRTWRTPSARGSNTASSISDPNAACSRATSRWTRTPTPTPPAGTHSSA